VGGGGGWGGVGATELIAQHARVNPSVLGESERLP
jgi:hypothetical protein